MSFVANGNFTPSDIFIKSNPFFPSVSLDDLRKQFRLDGSVTNERLRQSVIEEVIDVNRLLSQLMGQVEKLSDLSKGEIDGTPETDYLYFSAVFNGVAAKVNEKYRGYDTTNAGHKNADELVPTIDEYRRNKHWAIQQLLGQNHTVVELI